MPTTRPRAPTQARRCKQLQSCYLVADPVSVQLHYSQVLSFATGLRSVSPMRGFLGLILHRLRESACSLFELSSTPASIHRLYTLHDSTMLSVLLVCVDVDVRAQEAGVAAARSTSTDVGCCRLQCQGDADDDNFTATICQPAAAAERRCQSRHQAADAGAAVQTCVVSTTVRRRICL